MVDNWKYFQELVKKFDKETGGHSVIGPRYRNEHFKKMLELPNIIELFINDFLYCGAAHWHYKLAELTGDNPVDSSNWGRMENIRQDWLEWAYKKGIVKDERKFRNIRSQEAISIAKLIFPFPDLVHSKMNFNFCGQDPDGIENDMECVNVKFDAEVAGKIEKIKVIISPNLDCSSQYMQVDFFDVNSPGYMKYYQWESLPLRNQYYVQSKFIEWGYTPIEDEPKIFIYK